MRVVGITGGIGSGKSALAAAFAARGVPVVDADVIARRCVEPGTSGHSAIMERFGSGVLLSDGALDRAALAAIVFADSAALRDLEAITHPCIAAGIERALEDLRARPQPTPVAVVEHPLLVETGAHARVDVVVVVEAPIEERVRRVTSTRGMSEKDVRARIAAQTDDAGRRRVADVVVRNDGDLLDLEAEVGRIVALVGDRPSTGEEARR